VTLRTVSVLPFLMLRPFGLKKTKKIDNNGDMAMDSSAVALNPPLPSGNLGIQENLGFTTLQQAMLSAEVNRDPFPYLIIDQAFSTDEHRDLLRELPDDRHYRWKYVCGFRGMLGLERTSLCLLRARRLRQLRDLMLSEAFSRLLVSRFGGLPSAPPGCSSVTPRLKLFRDKAGYTMGAHIDGWRTALVLVIYLRIADDSVGMQLYRPHEELEWCEGHHTPIDAFEKIAHAPLSSGSGICIPREPNSFHAVNGGEPVDSVRDGLMYALYWQDESLWSKIAAKLNRTSLLAIDSP